MRYRLLAAALLSGLTLLSAEGLRVGRAELVITPPAGVPMAGYYSTRLATGTHDDLHAKALVLQSGDIRAALIACDLISVPPAVVEEARRLIEQQTGIPQAHVMISATHSHTGPLMMGGGARDAAYGGELEPAKKYIRDLPAKIAGSAVLASKHLQPATAQFAKGSETSINFNRRFFMKDGTVGWNPGKLNANIVKPAGPVDPDVALVYFESNARTPLASYVNFALHLDTVGGLEISADYPATMAALLGKAKSPGMLTLFTNGAAGNINHIDVKTSRPQKGHEEAARIGTVLADEVIRTFDRLRPAAAGDLKIRSRTLQLQPAPLSAGDVERAQAIARDLDAGKKVSFLDTVFAWKVIETAERKGKPLDAEVQVITLGSDIAWVALPGEIFTELGMAIKKASPYPMTMIVELAHGPVTYFPNEAAVPQGNYEVVTSRVAPGSGERLVEAAKQLLAEAHSQAKAAARLP
jgi:neutral ceramidase